MGRRNYNFNEIESMARAAGFDSSISPVMAAISLAESGGNPMAHNPRYPDNSYGLFQVNMLDEPGYMLGAERRGRYGLRSNDELFDPMTNLKAAKDIYDSQGLGAWSVFTSGAYKRHMPTSTSVMQVEKPLGQDLQAAMMGDASVGRGRSTGTNRKAGNKLLGLPEILSGAAQGIGNLRNALLQLSR